MKVKELIEELKDCKNKEVEVYIFDEVQSEIREINMVDLSIDDRVDLNMGGYNEEK